jgi:hypothetical protein
MYLLSVKEMTKKSKGVFGKNVLIKKYELRLSVLVCNSISQGGKNEEDCDLCPAWIKSSQDSISTKGLVW